MKKIFKKYGAVKSIGGCLDILGLLLAIIAAFLGKFEDVQMTMRVISCILIFIGLFMMALMAEKNKTLKLIGSFVLAAFVFTWILPYGYFNGATFVNYGLKRLGLADFGIGAYYAVSFTLEKILFILFLVGFYGVLSKISGYQQLVTSIAKKLKGKEVITALCMSLFIVAFTALSRQTFAALIFVPFFVSILSHMKVEKITAFAITYGSILIGILGVLYGSESLSDFNYYLDTELTTGLTYRGIILAVAFVLYNFFIVMRIRANKKRKNAEAIEDTFEVEAPKKKGHVYPVVITLVVVTILAILGYVGWSDYWEIGIFKDFHTWITSFSIGEDFPIFSYILGSNPVAFGEFGYLYVMDGILLIASAVLALIYRMKLSEYVAAAFEGLKKAIKPILVIIGIYTIFAFVYMSPVTPTLCNWFFSLTDSLNPVTASISAFIASMFNIDFGYTAYAIGAYLTTAYEGSLEIVHTIFTSMYGLVQVFLPSSLVLMVGLSLANIDYKSWFKYIWLFVVGMFIILIVFFVVLLYV